MVPPKSDNTSDDEKYIFFLSDVCLYVQIGTLNNVLYDEITRRWSKEDVLYFFRRFDMLEITAGINSSGVYSQQLWNESINPLRIYIVIVSYSSHTYGDYKKNPVKTLISIANDDLELFIFSSY
jgi:GTP cyclohydrolase III